MVAPLIIIGIILVASVGVLVFTPVGSVIQEAVESLGFTNPDNPSSSQDTIVPDDESTEKAVGDFEQAIYDLIGYGKSMGDESIQNSDFEDNPIGMTEHEAQDISDAGGEFFKALANFFFRGHDLIVATIYGLSPVQIALSVVVIIAMFVSIFITFKHLRHASRHWMLIVIAVVGVMLILVVVGGGLSI